MKKLVCIGLILISGCSGPELVMPEIVSVNDVFGVQLSKVVNKQAIAFKLETKGTYMLTLINKETNQVISRDKFLGQAGNNIRKIYTNSLPKGSLILVLEDSNKVQLKSTVLINN